MQRPFGRWLWHKAGRLWNRLLTGDFIRRRAKKIKPTPDLGTPAYAIAYNSYGGYCVPLAAAHRPAARFIMAGRVWEQETLALIASVADDGDIIHAGTFFGDFLPFLSKTAAPCATVWAFEPNALNYRAAKLTLAINEIDNVSLVHAGLGPSRARGALVVENARGLALGGASFIAAGSENTNRQETIEIKTLDEEIPKNRRVSVLQLDVEGYEEPALGGSLALLKRWRPVLVLETPPSDEWFATHLKPLGYAFDRRVDDNTIYAASEA